MNICGSEIPDEFFEDFLNDHLLIKALQGDAEIPDNIRGAMFQYCAQKDNKRMEIDALAFMAMFAARINNMIDYFGEKEMRDFFSKQLSAGKKKYDENVLLQALSEVECINYALCMLPGEKTAMYEPETNGKKNPEARIISVDNNAYSYDIEVKTPKFPERKDYIETRKKFLRVNIPINKNDLDMLKEFVEKKGYVFMLPSIGKLKDYINSAGEKFLTPTTSNQCNILFINWTFDDICESKLMQPIACLCNEKTGLLKSTQYHADFNISMDALKKISAIVVYKDTVDSFASLSLLNAINEGNCKIIINDKFCENVDRQKILRELKIPEANVVEDGASFQIFADLANPYQVENKRDAEQIAAMLNKILENQ